MYSTAIESIDDSYDDLPVVNVTGKDEFSDCVLVSDEEDSLLQEALRVSLGLPLHEENEVSDPWYNYFWS